MPAWLVDVTATVLCPDPTMHVKLHTWTVFQSSVIEVRYSFKGKLGPVYRSVQTAASESLCSSFFNSSFSWMRWSTGFL